MSKTVRKFKGKEYRQGHEPCELELTRIRAEKMKRKKDFIFKKGDTWDSFVNDEAELDYREAQVMEQIEKGY